MYNPYEEMLRRRQPEVSQSAFQQPAPVVPLPAYGGPELMPWMPENDQQANESAGTAGAGMAALIKRFRQPKGTGGLDKAAAGGLAAGLG